MPKSNQQPSQQPNFMDPDAPIFAEGANEVGDDAENLVLNLADANENGPKYEAMPPGIYNCVVENTEYGLSSNNNPMITWTFKVTDPLYDGRLLFSHTTLNNEVGQGRLKRMLIRLLPEVPLSAFRPRTFCDEGTAVGVECRVKVRIRPYKGERRNDVQDVLPATESGAGFLDQQ